MKNEWKAAFDSIQATESQKEAALRAVQKAASQKAPSQKNRAILRTAPALLLVMLTVIGCFLYFTPTIAVAVEGEENIVLSVNRFDRVIGAEGDVKLFGTCEETVQELLDQNADADLTIIGGGEQQRNRLHAGLQNCGASCSLATEEEAQAAETAGLSVGKYRAYLIWHELDQTVTPEDAAGLSMRQIYERIESLQGEGTTQTDHISGQGSHGSGNGNGTGNGIGSGNGNGNGNGIGSGNGKGNGKNTTANP